MTENTNTPPCLELCRVSFAPHNTISNNNLSANDTVLSLRVMQGENTVLFDHDSAALSRVMRVLAGFEEPAGGHVFLAGHYVTFVPPEQRHIGIISHQLPLFLKMSVRENVALPLKARGVPPARIIQKTGQMAALLGLEGFINTAVEKLSEAQKMRVLIARALVFEPPLVLLDNPFAHLDTPSRHELQTLWRRLARGLGLTTLMTTTERDEALFLAGQLVVLDSGRLVQAGTPRELLERPQDWRVARRVGQANCLTGLVQSHEDDCASIRLPNGAVVEAMATPELEEGALCVVCIPPERVAVTFSSAGDMELEGALQAELIDQHLAGDRLILRLRLHEGTELVVHRPPGQALPHAGFRPTALLAWSAQHASAFAHDP